MADRGGQGADLIVRKEFEDLRSSVRVTDTKSKTEKWLESQIQERIARIASCKGQMSKISGVIEELDEELAELIRRKETLKTIED